MTVVYTGDTDASKHDTYRLAASFDRFALRSLHAALRLFEIKTSCRERYVTKAHDPRPEPRVHVPWLGLRPCVHLNPTFIWVRGTHLDLMHLLMSHLGYPDTYEGLHMRSYSRWGHSSCAQLSRSGHVCTTQLFPPTCLRMCPLIPGRCVRSGCECLCFVM